MEKTKLSDSELISLYVQGKEWAFETLVTRYKSKVYTIIYLIVKDRYIAEDVFQETFIKAVKTIKGGKYNEEGKFVQWICRVAHNLAVDYFRKAKRIPEFTFPDGTKVFNSLEYSDESFETLTIKEDQMTLMKMWIQQLPEPQKEVLIMRHYMEMSFKDIANTTGVSINTALGRMRYALINLRKLMQEKQIAYDKNFYRS